MEGFVSIATFSNEIEAELAQATLAAAGIESFLKFSDVGGMIPTLSINEGVKLIVSEMDKEEASIVLSTPSAEPLSPP